jgi:probable addiction module antidote protein
MPKARAFDASKYRDNPKAIAKYLNDFLVTGDPILIKKAIGAMVKAQSVTRFSKKSGQRRDRLYLMFRAESSPAFDNILKVLMALDVRLVAKPAGAETRLR